MKRIGVIGAMEAEVSLLIQEMAKNGKVVETSAGSLVFFEGKIGNLEIVVVRSGVGKVNAACCAQRLIIQFNVEAIINTGIAGAMKSGLGIFDMVISENAVQHDMDCTLWGYKPCEIPQMNGMIYFKADEKISKLLMDGFEKSEYSKKYKAVLGTIASGDQFIADKNVKAHIKEICNPACCEMEGASIAHTCYLSNIPFAILRCMSDMADDTANSKNQFNENEAANQSAAVLMYALTNM